MYKHKLRKKVFEQGQWRTKIVHTDGELGSGRFDKNGREIFEGDIVTFGVHKRTVCWSEGELVLRADGKPDESFFNFFSENECQLEVVGHADD